MWDALTLLLIGLLLLRLWQLGRDDGGVEMGNHPHGDPDCPNRQPDIWGVK